MAERVVGIIKTLESKQKCSNSCKRSSGNNSSGSPADRILQLQKTTGNQAVQRLIKSRALQAKLKISQPNDIYEQKADRVAEQVMRMSETKVQRQDEEEENIQSKQVVDQIVPLVHRYSGEEEKGVQTEEFTEKNMEINSDFETRIKKLKEGGQPLPKATRDFFEPRFGCDFSNVRLHKENIGAVETSKVLNARAYTIGNNVIFGAGQFALETSSGKKLLAHELTHVVQQGAYHNRQTRNFKPAGSENLPLTTQKSITPLPTPHVQASFISWVLKMGAKRVSKGMLKNYIRTRIKERIKKIAMKDIIKKFSKEADDLLDILEDPWWVTAIGFIPVAGDAFDLVRVPKQIIKAMKKAEELEDKISRLLKIQGRKAGELIRASLKKVEDYPSELDTKTYSEIVQLAKSGSKGAKKLKKLIEQEHRLMEN